MIVNAIGLGLIAGIVWYFFLGKRAAPAGLARGEGDVQRIEVKVKGGYSPETISARPGLPLEIGFSREEDSPCSDEVWFPSLGIKAALPAFERTLVRIPATPNGRYPFTCGMNMLHGVLVLESPGEIALPTQAPAPPERAEKDPVCGMDVLPSKAAAQLQADGKPVYFCSSGCRDHFERTRLS
jgi:Cu+-exporting ATPase